MLAALRVYALSPARRRGATTLSSSTVLAEPRRSVALCSSSTSDEGSVWQAMKLVDLKAACRRRGLKVSGTKAELVARLSEAPETKDVVVSPTQTEPAPDEPSITDARVGFVDSSVREEHELEVGGSKIKCFTTASRLVAQEKAGKVEGGRGVLLRGLLDEAIAAGSGRVPAEPPAAMGLSGAPPPVSMELSSTKKKRRKKMNKHKLRKRRRENRNKKRPA